MKKKYKIVTLGCRTNQYESQAYRDQLKFMGLLEAKTDENIDICIINTCSVTKGAEKASISEIKNLRKQHADTKFFLTGCMTKNILEYLDDDITVIPNLQKQNLLESIFPQRVIPKFNIREFNNHTRAFVKIQDGCNSFCTYCIIPYTRGRSRSRKVEDIINEVKSLVDNRYKEIVLTGINLGDFSTELNLAQLIEELDEIEDLMRIRLSSIDPRHVTDELTDVIFNSKKVTPSLHISLQSGSNKILKKMNRSYTKEDLLKVVEKLRRINPDFTFTTDVIVGFPSENEKDFEETLDLIREVKFLKVHMFPFSPRENTPAFTYEDKVPEDIIFKRKQRLLKEASKVGYNFRNRFIGKKLQVLLEKEKSTMKGFYLSHSQNFLPIYVPFEESLESNTIHEVIIIKNTSDHLIGEICR